MSRCFSFPPPGFTLSKEQEETLIRLIKIREGRAKAKEQRKIEKSEQKRKEKKEQRKSKKQKITHTFDKYDDANKNICRDTKESETEFFERSSLSEEHENPVPSTCSYDSTGSSNKTKRYNHEVSSVKPNESDASLNEKEITNSGHVKAVQQKLSSQYKNLIDNWVPPQVQNSCFESNELDWLFRSKNSCEKSLGVVGNSCSLSVSLWNRASYLPEVDVYALPYVVLF